MSSLLSIHDLSKSHGSLDLFDGLSFTISEGDRIGLIGPNGSGKSTLLKILMGFDHADRGHISKRQGLKIGYASQSPSFPSVSLEEVLLREMEGGDEVENQAKARILLGKAQFSDFTQNASKLSGGWKKRLDIVRALILEPDLLLLDEPTNHLDLEGILWLEKFLSREKISYLVISHDRYFLEKVANRIIEINKCFPSGFFSSKGNMTHYGLNKEAFLEGQAEQERSLASLVRTETDWLRRSPKARTTKSEARVQKAHQLISELSSIRQRNKTVKVDIDFLASERETRKLLTANNLSKSLGGSSLFKGIDLVLSPGSRLGVIGKNGTGKTTLLKILAGEISQDMGTIKYADNLKLVYFDQHREQVPLDVSVREALSPGSDIIQYRGQSIHVNGWAKRFLFSPDRLELPVKCLSGGERARILIARLMLQPADILFLDEPTNDLDIPTLEVLEESLKEFTGAIVLITHDRCLMDRLCTQILSLGETAQFFSDYTQWERSSSFTSSKKDTEEKRPSLSQTSPKPIKLSYKEQKELEAMEGNIVSCESEIEELQKQLDDPKVQGNSQKSLEIYHLMGTKQKQLDELFERWQVLLNKSKGIV